MEYTGHQLSKVYKQGDSYVVLSEADELLMKEHGLPCHTRLVNYREKKCTRCPASLLDIEEEEMWVMDEDWRLWCGRCQPARPLMIMLTPNRHARLPLRAHDIVRAIKEHPDYPKLNRRTKERLSHLLLKTYGDKEDNQRRRELVDLWKFVYWAQIPVSHNREMTKKIKL